MRRTRRSGDGDRERRRVVLLLVDGARPDVFAELASRGDLPSIQRHVLEPGGTVPATTVLPSTTCVAYLPMLTGCYPGTCNVPGIRWLDVAAYGGRWWQHRTHVRSYCGPQGGLLDRDIAAARATLFDLIDDSVAIATPVSRGLAPHRVRGGLARLLLGSVAHYTGRYGLLDREVGRALVRTVPERPSFTFAVFPGVDGVTHVHDPRHPSVAEAYRVVDRALGAYAAAAGLDDDPLVILISDHGLSAVHTHADIAVALERLGYPTLRHPAVWRRRPAVAVMVSGNGAAHVYLRPGQRRDRRFTLADIECGDVPGISRLFADQLAALEGVALVAAVDDDGVSVVSRNGRAHLRHTAGVIAYEPRSDDVLELGGRSARDERAWLGCTIDARFPDAPAQLLQLFRSARAGDLVVLAAEGFDLRGPWEIPAHRSGHGSLHSAHMRCLLAANRPLQGPMRTVDVFPLVLSFLGLAVPEEIDAGHPWGTGARRFA